MEVGGLPANTRDCLSSKRWSVERRDVGRCWLDYKGASDTFIDFNVQLALTAAKRIYARTGKCVRLLLPDGGEYNRSSEMFRTALDMAEGVSMGHLQEKSGGGLLGGLQGLFGSGDREAMMKAAERAELFIVLNVSTVELIDAERYCNELPEDKALVFWNCELDTLRSDLGLLGFPPKDLHYRFTSRFLPVFYIRPRDYSKTVPVAPFVINYSGALFREYPGPWQVMLKQDGGMYACVAESRRRYTLGNAKEELMKAMRLNTEEEGSAMEFLRRGYKRSTWWEDDEDKEESHAWRS